MRRKLGQILSKWGQEVYAKDKSRDNLKALIYGFSILSSIHEKEKTDWFEERLTALEAEFEEYRKQAQQP
jgi:hypothetical protein